MVKPILNTFVFKLLSAILNLLTVVIISRYMGAEVKGETSLILTTITFMLIASNIIGGSTLVYLVPRYSLLSLILPSYVWTILSGLISAGIIYALDILPPVFVFHVLGLSILNDIMATNLNVLLGKEQITSYNRISLIQIFLSLVVLLTMIFTFNVNNIFTYLLSLYFSYGVCALYSFFKILKWIKPEANKQQSGAFKEMIKVGATNQASHLIQFFGWRLSYYIISEQNGESALGIFSNGVSLAESAWILINSIITVQYSIVANASEKAAAITLKALKLGIMASVPLLLVLCFLPDVFYTWLFGSDFVGISTIICLLSPGIFMYSIALIIGHYYSGTGRYYINTIGNSVGFVFTATLSYSLFKDYNLYTAAIISSVAYSTSCLFVLTKFITENKISYLSVLPGIRDIRNAAADIKSVILKKNNG